MTSTLNSADIKRLLSVLDATLLDPNATEDDIKSLCDKAKDTPVVSVCVMPKWVKTAKTSLEGTDIAVCAAINFPGGDASDDEVVEEALQAVKDGATELDVVVPYDIVAYDQGFAIKSMIEEVVAACPKSITIKAILETGKLKGEKEIRQAAGAAAMGGADFLKTSTGFTDIGATPEAVAILAEFIKMYPGKVGLKISGGIKDAETATAYWDQVEEILGMHWCHRKRFRLGGGALFHTLAE